MVKRFFGQNPQNDKEKELSSVILSEAKNLNGEEILRASPQNDKKFGITKHKRVSA